MATIETMNVKLGINTSPLRAGSKRAVASIQLVRSNVDRLDSALSKIGKVTAVASLASALTQVTAAAAPAAGAVAALPAAAAIAGTAFAAVKVATSGMGDAFSAVAEGDAKKLDEALKDLAPSAQAVVREFQRVHKRFENVQKSVQGKFFRGLDTELNLLASKYLPMMRKGLGSVSTEINGLLKEASAAARSDFFSGVVAGTMNRTADSLRILRNAVKPVMNTVAGLVKVGLPFMDQLSQWVVRNARLAESFVTSERGARKLSQIIKTSGEVLKTLGSIAVNIGKVIGGIFSAANQDGGSLLRKIRQIVTQMAAWVNSAEGQRQIAAIFQLLSTVAGKTALILGAIFRIGMKVAQWINSLPGPIRNLITTFLAWTVATAFISNKLRILGPVFKLLGKGIGKFAAKVVPLFAKIATRALLMAGRVALSWIIAMGPIGWVIAAVVGLVALIIWKWKTIRKWTARIFGAVWNFIKGIWQSIQRWVARQIVRVLNFVDRLGRIPGKVARFFGRAKEAAVSAFTRLVAFVASIPGRILSALGSLGSLLWDAGRSVIEGLINGIESAVGWLQSKLEWVTGLIPDWKGPRSKDRRILEPAGQAIMEGLVNGIGSMIPQLRKQLTTVTRTIERSPLQRAASQMLKHLQGGGRIFEDFSFRGASELVSAKNDVLAKRFSRANPNFDFGQVGTRGRMERFLKQAAQPTVRLEVDGADEDMKRLIRRMVRTDGRGDVQVAFG